MPSPGRPKVAHFTAFDYQAAREADVQKRAKVQAAVAEMKAAAAAVWRDLRLRYLPLAIIRKFAGI